MINYTPQINVDKILKYSKKRVIAGEDGYIKIIYKDIENILEKMTGNDDFLASIEDVDEFENGDIIACASDGDFGLYIYNKKENSYILKKLEIKIKDDCIYNIETKEEASLSLTLSEREGIKPKKKKTFECWGEKNIKYKFVI